MVMMSFFHFFLFLGSGEKILATTNEDCQDHQSLYHDSLGFDDDHSSTAFAEAPSDELTKSLLMAAMK
jgi:hypothetical protein